MRLVEIMWLAIAAISVVEVVYSWETDRNRSYLFAAFCALATFMYFFRKRQRFRYISRNQDKD